MRLIFLLFLSFSTFAQDLYNFENSRKYGDYLLKSGQYDLAGKELERLVYFATNNDTLKTDLLKAYRLSNQTQLGLNKVSQLYYDSQTIPYAPALEISKLYMQKTDWEGGKNFWNVNQNIGKEDKILLTATTEIFNNKFDKALNTLSNIKTSGNELAEGYLSILEREQHKKSPALAGLMSMVIPGIGKAYSNNWKDGLVSLFFTAGMAVQSYRNFNKHGINNYRGWIYGGIGFGFYLGNIYGSVKSTKDYNRKKTNKLLHEASALFNSHY